MARNAKDGPAESFTARHQIGVSASLLFVLWLSRAARFPSDIGGLYRLSYYDDISGEYGRGPNDFYFVLFWLIVFIGLRIAVMDYVLRPLARGLGARRSRDAQRFSERSYNMLYHLISFGVGMHLWIYSKYWSELREMWTDTPVTGISGMMKGYYLLSFAFALQQIVIIHIEQARSDHWAMLAHHIVTSVLLFGSYSLYQTRVGSVIVCIMDVADIFLSLTKVFNYLAWHTACNITFLVFFIVWFVTRHVIYPMIVWSVYADAFDTIPLGCFSAVTGRRLSQPKASSIVHYLQPFVYSDGTVCIDTRVYWSMLILLGTLEILMLFWFSAAAKIIWAFITGSDVNDTRSEVDEKEMVEEATNGVIPSIEKAKVN
ncbi:TLC domain-containing protein [Lophiotrema nucula]|uniref:TLC domain-containing protein n=1 Tax=Lophiotrema nucula TaxID=690887 RepID=A0A6A5ZJK7_9PLEO|nr:TLC domain-containing protein [Lophiotrema nucula]